MRAVHVRLTSQGKQMRKELSFNLTIPFTFPDFFFFFFFLTKAETPLIAFVLAKQRINSAAWLAQLAERRIVVSAFLWSRVRAPDRSNILMHLQVDRHSSLLGSE